MRHVSRDLFPSTMLPSAVWSSPAVFHIGGEKNAIYTFVKRFIGLNWHYIMMCSYPIKSTTTADRIRRAISRLKVLKTVVKRLELDPLILCLSEKRGGSITGPVYRSQRLAV